MTMAVTMPSSQTDVPIQNPLLRPRSRTSRPSSWPYRLEEQLRKGGLFEGEPPDRAGRALGSQRDRHGSPRPLILGGHRPGAGHVRRQRGDLASPAPVMQMDGHPLVPDVQGPSAQPDPHRPDAVLGHHPLARLIRPHNGLSNPYTWRSVTANPPAAHP
jgi:hypothetical protein